MHLYDNVPSGSKVESLSLQLHRLSRSSCGGMALLRYGSASPSSAA